jgi:peroxiredoxin
LDFEAVTLDGQTVRLSDYVGQGPVLLNFMHTWCVPCNRSAPHMVRVYEAHESEGFTIVSVSVDEPVQAGQDFVARYGIQYPFLRDPRSSAFRKYALAGMPTSLMLDKEGTIRAIWPGELTEAQIEQGLAQFAMVQR